MVPRPFARHKSEAWNLGLISIQELPRLSPRPEISHKGMFGHALLVGGSPGMSGAICIAAMLALRCGAGLVTAAVPQASQPIVAGCHPCLMTLGWDEQPEGRWGERVAEQLLGRYRPGMVLGIGPGLGRAAGQQRLAAGLVAEWPGTAVVDADALAAVVKRTTLSGMPPRILTPHPGEWERLCGVGADDTAGQRVQAVAWAQQTGWVIVLKGHSTLVTDGHRYMLNPTGNPSLAVGGSGDALVGVITALACQGLGPWEAAVLGTYLHGLAADLAHAKLGTPSTLATDLLDAMPAAFRWLASHAAERESDAGEPSSDDTSDSGPLRSER
ncbi:MAG: NAD(P)H-hydrate dehydratase [Pirellula sp.]